MALNTAAPARKMEFRRSRRGSFQLRLVNPRRGWLRRACGARSGICDAYVARGCPREQMLRETGSSPATSGGWMRKVFLYLLSRKTAVINLAGRKFSRKIEAVLDRHPPCAKRAIYNKLTPSR